MLFKQHLVKIKGRNSQYLMKVVEKLVSPFPKEYTQHNWNWENINRTQSV